MNVVMFFVNRKVVMILDREVMRFIIREVVRVFLSGGGGGGEVVLHAGVMQVLLGVVEV